MTVLSENEKYGITRENLLEITKIVSKKMAKLKRILDNDLRIELSNKNLSEIVGKVLEKEIADYLSKVSNYQVINAHSDKDPDLQFLENNHVIKSIEIKVTSTTNAWTGGEFSKRPFDYLLISWGGNFDEFFIAYIHLEKDNWKSNISKSYYGPSFTVKMLNERKDKVILLGAINERGTRVIRETVT
ncbi:MAG: hypothetical protein K9W42_05340 [Candidatus Heimdallarchaeota archaeon]|nr:hypothetical protein [Candidatus Heimdallarchaeota archaeon]